jgi:hypothetical protein
MWWEALSPGERYMAQHITNLVTVTERGVMTETSVRRGPKVDEPSSKDDDGGDDDAAVDDDDDASQPRRRRQALGVLGDGDGEDDDEGEVSILTELLMAASVGSKQLTAGSRLLTAVGEVWELADQITRDAIEASWMVQDATAVAATWARPLSDSVRHQNTGGASLSVEYHQFAMEKRLDFTKPSSGLQ